MAGAGTSSSNVTSRYAGALIDLADQAGVSSQIQKDLSALRAMLSDSADLRRAISSPRISRAQQAQALAALADKAKFHALTKNFLGVLSANRRLRDIEGIITAFFAALDRREGRVTAQVRTAQDLTDAQRKALQAALSKGLNSEVSIEARVEPSLLGGLVVTVGSRMVDDSVARKLERLQAAMNAPAGEDKAA